jgi:hypothetical protein
MLRRPNPRAPFERRTPGHGSPSAPTALDWGYEFKAAPDLEQLGAALARKLDSWVAKAPPTDPQSLADRLFIEKLVGSFIDRSRERDFASHHRIASGRA